MKFDNNSNSFKVIVENKLNPTNSVSANIAFKLSKCKPKILDAIIKIRDSKKHRFHFSYSIPRLRISIKIQFKFSSLNCLI